MYNLLYFAVTHAFMIQVTQSVPSPSGTQN